MKPLKTRDKVLISIFIIFLTFFITTGCDNETTPANQPTKNFQEQLQDLGAWRIQLEWHKTSIEQWSMRTTSYKEGNISSHTVSVSGKSKDEVVQKTIKQMEEK